MLVDLDEKMLLFDVFVFKCFYCVVNCLGMNLEIILLDDLLCLGEFDGLFICVIINISNYIYCFVKIVEKMGLVVMDDFELIMKCINKVFLIELLEINKVFVLKSVIICSFDLEWKIGLME